MLHSILSESKATLFALFFLLFFFLLFFSSFFLFLHLASSSARSASLATNQLHTPYSDAVSTHHLETTAHPFADYTQLLLEGHVTGCLHRSPSSPSLSSALFLCQTDNSPGDQTLHPPFTSTFQLDTSASTSFPWRGNNHFTALDRPLASHVSPANMVEQTQI